MCGRLAQYRSWQEMLAYYSLIGAAQNLAARYNVAPTSEVGTVRLSAAGREHTMMRWWLVPSWWKKSIKEVPTAFNAKAEGIDEKPMFRAAFRHRRCIVWADGFYEWRREGRQKTPYYITRADGAPLSFAGLWETWTSPEDGETLKSCTIITCPANREMAPLHPRMPVVLERDTIDDWMSAAAGKEVLLPCGEGILTTREVSSYVGNARHEGEQCIAPVGA